MPNDFFSSTGRDFTKSPNRDRVAGVPLPARLCHIYVRTFIPDTTDFGAVTARIDLLKSFLRDAALPATDGVNEWDCSVAGDFTFRRFDGTYRIFIDEGFPFSFGHNKFFAWTTITRLSLVEGIFLRIECTRTFWTIGHQMAFGGPPPNATIGLIRPTCFYYKSNSGLLSCYDPDDENSPVDILNQPPGAVIGRMLLSEMDIMPPSAIEGNFPTFPVSQQKRFLFGSFRSDEGLQVPVFDQAIPPCCDLSAIPPP